MQTRKSCDDNDIEKRAASFLQLLRNTTAPKHSILESHPLLLAIVSPGVTIRQYYAYLILMHKVIVAYEKLIVPLIAEHLFVSGQRQASLMIEEDIQFIGGTLPDEINAGIYALPEGSMSIPFALGFRYVMEGSKLGGSVIYNHIRRNLKFSANQGACYLSNGGADTTAQWINFLSQFSAYIAKHSGENEAVQGAVYAFSSVYDFVVSNQLVYDI